MLLTARTYRLAQTPDKGASSPTTTFYGRSIGWQDRVSAQRRARKMLLVHQTGNVKIGEVVRYTLTYTPSNDRILPSPPHLFVKIKNTSAIPLRAAYLHGPYTLYVATYPSTFDSNTKLEDPRRDGVPEFEPNLKAGGQWTSRLNVPEDIRETAGKVNSKRTADGALKSVTWIIEITSQIIFSTSAAVHFELLVGRDEKSLDLGFAAVTGVQQSTPGQVQDHQQGKHSKDGAHMAQPKGVFSKAVGLVVDDTASLWNKPAMPELESEKKNRERQRMDAGFREESTKKCKDSSASMPSTSDGKGQQAKKTNVHLVILSHGLHSNLGADMLYVKESIDAAAKQARIDSSKRKTKYREQERAKQASKQTSRESIATANTNIQDHATKNTSSIPLSPKDNNAQLEQPKNCGDDDDEVEQVIVRGFGGNAVRTERGIQYLGKRLAKWVLAMTYPDQPYLPIKRSATKKLSMGLKSQSHNGNHKGEPVHAHSDVFRKSGKGKDLAYRITSISFVGHSLGGLTQTYAIAYIQKHSPSFFTLIKPINFVCMASPMLGLSNENPMYVKFALDFGLVGRTGQDLGLTWRAPTIARSGWGAMVGGLGAGPQERHKNPDPGSKPLLRILPTGPAHIVLKKFRNRTLYSNVVNDGIVPLRTSCLLFLDWRGLGRVDKARRENGLVGTMVGWGWAEMTGANSTAHRQKSVWADGGTSTSEDEAAEEGRNTATKQGYGRAVPQPSQSATKDDTTMEVPTEPESDQFLRKEPQSQDDAFDGTGAKDNSQGQDTNPFSAFLALFRPQQQKPQPQPQPTKKSRIYSRSQTLKPDSGEGGRGSSFSSDDVRGPHEATNSRPGATRGDSLIGDPNNVLAPPKTTFFESAGDVLNPPLPPVDFLIDPTNRPRTIFHDRVYHPNDIPTPPPPKRKAGNHTNSVSSDESSPPSDTSPMKVEEKIARAYHRDLTWRKVLVRLEPDAHNNMIVRRMFANAYGWPVVKHMVDTHFGDTVAATTADEDEPGVDRAQGISKGTGEHGEEVKEQLGLLHDQRRSENAEARDEVREMGGAAGRPDTPSTTTGGGGGGGGRPKYMREDSVAWSDGVFEGTDDDDVDDASGEVSYAERNKHNRQELSSGEDTEEAAFAKRGTSEVEIADFLTASPSTESPVQEISQL
ncbi:MAG: hypothetical protein M1836_001987 [Candelina mexicana]|nr:MAG: hypothetical protein M1836_001987 [Candelina mexicana]